MTTQMTHSERVLATLQGQEVDRPPASMWRHHFGDERTAEGLAEATLAFQRTFDWDFVKVNPRATYHAEAWGLPVSLTGEGHPNVLGTLVREPRDWRQFESLSLDQAVLQEHLQALELIMRGLQDDIPVLMTVFNPISIAARMTSSGRLFAEHLREHWEEVQPALEAITETFSRFGRACLERGASGIFFATTAWATRKRLTEEEYELFAQPYDLALLNSLSEAEFHLLHVCQDENMLHALRDYPVHAFNWDAQGIGNASLVEGKQSVQNKPVVGGISHLLPLIKATPEEITGEVHGLRLAMGHQGWMLGPGCTFDPSTPGENLHAIRQAIE